MRTNREMAVSIRPATGIAKMILCSIETNYCVPFSIVDAFLFKPPAPYAYTFPNEVIQLKTSHGNRICATFIRRPGASLVLLLSHGNAEDLNTAFGFMQRLSLSLDVNVVGYDYSGYGCSTGTCAVFRSPERRGDTRSDADTSFAPHQACQAKRTAMRISCVFLSI